MGIIELNRVLFVKLVQGGVGFFIAPDDVSIDKKRAAAERLSKAGKEAAALISEM